MCRALLASLLVLPLLAAYMGCATDKERIIEAPATVDHVDLDRFAGRWYEISHMPQFFETDCMAGTVEYTPLADGSIKVVGICHKETYDGPAMIRAGTAHIVDPATNAKFKVRQGGTEQEQWIIGLDPEYRWVVIGSPNRRSLRLLSRQPSVNVYTHDAMKAIARDKGFETDRLVTTEAPTLP